MSTLTTRLEIPYPQQSDLNGGVGGIVTHFDAMSDAADLGYFLRFATSSARNAAIPSPTTGQYAYVLDLDCITIWNGSAWVRHEIERIFYRSTASVLTTSTFTDPDFTVPLEANGTYRYSLWNRYGGTVAGTTVGNFYWTVPSGCLMRRANVVQGTGSTGGENSGTAAYDVLGAASDTTQMSRLSASAAIGAVHENGIFLMGSSAGNAVLNYNKNAAHSSVTLARGGLLTVTRIV